jgi:deoxyribodipyrimidine photo-lyase
MNPILGLICTPSSDSKLRILTMISGMQRRGKLVREGRIHNYLRMLWGKKILEWSVSPPKALERMIELNNKYALDGRNPNSYSGIFWVLGRYDRAWGPQRPIFGKVRYMSSESARRKFKLKRYLDRYAQ